MARRRRLGLIPPDIETPGHRVSSLRALRHRSSRAARPVVDGEYFRRADLNRALQIHTGLSPSIASRLLGAYAKPRPA